MRGLGRGGAVPVGADLGKVALAMEGWSKDIVVGIHHHDGVEVGVGPRSKEGSEVLIESGEGFSEILREMVGSSKMGVGSIRAVAVTGVIADEDAKAVASFPLEMDPIYAMGSVVD
jgi:hypothetical protein